MRGFGKKKKEGEIVGWVDGRVEILFLLVF